MGQRLPWGNRWLCIYLMKHLADDDFVICGFIDKGNHVSSIVLGQYRAQKLVYTGHVTFVFCNQFTAHNWETTVCHICPSRSR